MVRKKLKHFAELKSLPNSFEEGNAYDGEWAKNHFKNENEIVLELACGHGIFLLEMARRHPEKNFIGIDIKGARIWRGAKIAEAEGLKNVAFLRVQIEHLGEYFNEGEVSEIWITFPDPHPRDGKSNKRLTSERFIEIYRNILKNGGNVKLKTDDEKLYQFSIETALETKCDILEQNPDIYAKKPKDEDAMIQTVYEKKHLAIGRKIHYLQIELNDNP